MAQIRMRWLGQVENTKVLKWKYGNLNTEVRRKAAYQCLVPLLTHDCALAVANKGVTLQVMWELSNASDQKVEVWTAWERGYTLSCWTIVLIVHAGVTLSSHIAWRQSPFGYCMQPIKNWRREWPGNEASLVLVSFWDYGDYLLVSLE